jgi:hypothetical protein
MPQDKTIKGVIERFRGIFSGDLGHIKAWDKDGKVVNIEDIEQFIQQEIKDALEERDIEIMEKSTIIIGEDNKKDNSFFKVPYRVLVEGKMKQ